MLKASHTGSNVGNIRSFVMVTLTHSLIYHFETVPNSKKVQKTTEMWLIKGFKIQKALKIQILH